MTEPFMASIEPGDMVLYLSSEGEVLGEALGKVLAVFRTLDGKVLADVEWGRLGLPKRLAIERLRVQESPSHARDT